MISLFYLYTVYYLDIHELNHEIEIKTWKIGRRTLWVKCFCNEVHFHRNGTICSNRNTLWLNMHWTTEILFTLQHRLLRISPCVCFMIQTLLYFLFFYFVSFIVIAKVNQVKSISDLTNRTISQTITTKQTCNIIPRRFIK